MQYYQIDFTRQRLEKLLRVFLGNRRSTHAMKRIVYSAWEIEQFARAHPELFESGELESVRKTDAYIEVAELVERFVRSPSPPGMDRRYNYSSLAQHTTRGTVEEI